VNTFIIEGVPMSSRSVPLCLAWMAAVVLAASSVLAGALTSTATDPEGDLTLFPSCDPLGCQAYQDIIRVETTKRGGVFVLSMQVAAPIPESPSLQEGVKQITWDWALDTDPDTFPAGFPLPPSNSLDHEFIVWVVWDGHRFAAQLVDRRPLLTGGDVILTSVPFKIKNTEITVILDETLIDDPPAFDWRSGTTIYCAVTEQGNWSLIGVDGVGPSLPWPA
jgi:hypothetical protein